MSQNYVPSVLCNTMYCVYCKQCMLLLLATCYCCIIHQLLWFMYRCVFTVGVVIIRNNLTLAADFLTNYSYINASDNRGNGVLLARCLTGLGPSGSDNGVLGGWYFNGNMIINSDEKAPCSSNVIQVRPGSKIAGVSNIRQCRAFSTTVEGIYTCIMMTSSMMNQSFRLGIYFNGRSESLDLRTYHVT